MRWFIFFHPRPSECAAADLARRPRAPTGLDPSYVDKERGVHSNYRGGSALVNAKNPIQIWPCLCGILLNTSVTSLPTPLMNLEKNEVGSEVGEGVKNDPTQIWPYLCGILFTNSFPRESPIRDRYVY